MLNSPSKSEMTAVCRLPEDVLFSSYHRTKFRLTAQGNPWILCLSKWVCSRQGHCRPSAACCDIGCGSRGQRGWHCRGVSPALGLGGATDGRWPQAGQSGSGGGERSLSSPRRVCGGPSPAGLISCLCCLCVSLCLQGERGMPGLPGRHGSKVPCNQRVLLVCLSSP